MYKFVLAEDKHIPEIIKNISPKILQELKILSNIPVEETLRLCVKSEESWVAIVPEGIVCMFGVERPIIVSNRGVPWFITTTLINKHLKAMLKGTKIAIKYWMERYDVLENYIPASFEESIRWVRWAGFTVYPAEPVGVAGQLVHRVEMIKI